MRAGMEQQSLGSQGAMVSKMGLGCMGMSEFYGPRDDRESAAAILRALDLGITFLDTADMYGCGHNEQLIGETIRGRRDEVFLATKFGIVRKIEDPMYRALSGKPEYVRAACDASLRRLGVDHIDLLYQHRMDPETPVEETVGAMARLVQAGKVRFIGLSEASAATIRRAHRVHPLTAVETEYSLWQRHVEREILPTVRELGIGFVAYSPLGRGFLTGAYTRPSDFAANDFRSYRYPRLAGEAFEKNRAIVVRFTELAATRGVKAGQLALAWVMAQGGDVFPIPGTKRRRYLEENAEAVHIRLTAADLEAIEKTVPVDQVRGDRYTASAMRGIEE